MEVMLTRRAVGRRIGAGLAGLAAAGLLSGRSAHALALPSEKPILAVSGKIGAANEDGAARFDRPMLESLGVSAIETTCPWFDGQVRFEGPRMDRLLDAVGAQGDTVVARALNDYVTELPRDDFARYGVILAMKLNGSYMTVRNKGPLFIVYPYDSSPELKHQKYYSRSAWQVAQLEVK